MENYQRDERQADYEHTLDLLGKGGLGAERRRQNAAYEASRYAERERRALLMTKLVVAGLGLIIFTLWAVGDRTREGDVSSMTWEHTTLVQTWSDVLVGRWMEEAQFILPIPPVNGRGERPGMERVPETCAIREHHREAILCGTYEECDKEGCWEVPDYCSRPVYRIWCQYITQEWKTVGALRANGTGRETRWMDPHLGSQDRARYHATYIIRVSYRDHLKERTYSFGGDAGSPEMTFEEALIAEDSYRKWNPNEKVLITIYNTGGIRSVQQHQVGFNTRWVSIPPGGGNRRE